MSGFLSPKSAAVYCDCHYKTFLALARREGLVPDGRIGTRARYSVQQLDRFVKMLKLRAEQTRHA